MRADKDGQSLVHPTFTDCKMKRKAAQRFIDTGTRNYFPIHRDSTSLRFLRPPDIRECKVHELLVESAMDQLVLEPAAPGIGG